MGQANAVRTQFDPTIANVLVSKDVQAAIDELALTGGVSASPGYTFGKSGNVNSGTFLQQETVPSNITGRTIGVNNGFVTEIAAGSQDADTYDLEIYSHDGNSINLTLLTTVSVVAARIATFLLGSPVAVAKGKQLAVKVSSGSTKNPSAVVIVKGSLT